MKKAIIPIILMLITLTGLWATGDVEGVEQTRQTSAGVELPGEAPKYVFLMIGDGLGTAQRQLAEFYLDDGTGDFKLTMNRFPILGMNTTNSLDSLVTDSAAAATALACGVKTNSDLIAVTPDGEEIPTLLEMAEEKGMSTGMVTTTRITHATPASFAAHNMSRDDENGIADDYFVSGVDFFAGGGIRHCIPASFEPVMGPDGNMIKSKRSDERDLFKEFEELGYDTFLGVEGVQAFREYQPEKGSQVFAAFTYSHMPYELDRINLHEVDVPSLAEMTEKAIDTLSMNDNGFVLMVEGGRIDLAAHANDPAGVIFDVIAFDDAVAEAYDFYLKHPDETLIVVVGDHETGGLGLGFSVNFFVDMEPIRKATLSLNDYLGGKVAYDGDKDEFYAILGESFGLSDLNDEEVAGIETLMDLVDNDEAPAQSALYGFFDPVAAGVAHVISERANIQWTTFAHTGSTTPLTSIGVGSEIFGGYKDNTEISILIQELMGF